MSSTRFYDDSARISKKLQMDTNAGRYALMTPAVSYNLPYIADPHIRLEKWGANTFVNAIGIEGDLLGLTRKLTHDNIDLNDYNKNSVYKNQKSFSINNHVLVDESRTTHPAFMYREAEMYRFEKPFLDPQANLERPFHHNIETRIIEKDIWTENYLAQNKNMFQ